MDPAAVLLGRKFSQAISFEAQAVAFETGAGLCLSREKRSLL
jgi:hypothetical protein